MNFRNFASFSQYYYFCLSGLERVTLYLYYSVLLRITPNYSASLCITLYHSLSLCITPNHCKSLSITAHHSISLCITLFRSISLSITIITPNYFTLLRFVNFCITQNLDNEPLCRIAKMLSIELLCFRINECQSFGHLRLFFNQLGIIGFFAQLAFFRLAESNPHCSKKYFFSRIDTYELVSRFG